MKLEDKVAVITGGANGIGKRMSVLFAREGAKVVIADFDISSAEKLAAEIKASGNEAIAIRLDHTDEADCVKMADAALKKYGQIDILANVAGVWPQKDGQGIDEGRWHNRMDPEVRSGFANSTKENWDRVLDVNLNGPRNCTRAVINHMIERKTGKIINFSSIAAIRGLVNGIEYATAKAAILGFTLTLALEVEKYGIQVNSIAPAGTLSERMLKGVERARAAGRQVDENQYCTPEEVAEMALFLASDGSNHTSAQNFVVGTPNTP